MHYCMLVHIPIEIVREDHKIFELFISNVKKDNLLKIPNSDNESRVNWYKVVVDYLNGKDNLRKGPSEPWRG